MEPTGDAVEIPTADSAFEELATVVSHDSGVDEAALAAAAKEADEKHAEEMKRMEVTDRCQIVGVR